MTTTLEGSKKERVSDYRSERCHFTLGRLLLGLNN